MHDSFANNANRFVATTVLRAYRSRDGKHLFRFNFVTGEEGFITVYCLSHPSLNGQSASSYLTHIFPDGKLCISPEYRPFTQLQAESLAAIWAEHFVRYRNGEFSTPDFMSAASE